MILLHASFKLHNIWIRTDCTPWLTIELQFNWCKWLLYSSKLWSAAHFYPPNKLGCSGHSCAPLSLFLFPFKTQQLHKEIREGSSSWPWALKQTMAFYMYLTLPDTSSSIHVPFKTNVYDWVFLLVAKISGLVADYSSTVSISEAHFYLERNVLTFQVRK